MTASAATPALEVTRLNKRFGGLPATREVSLTVMPGERRLIIGPNGAGKTTLFNLVTGDLTPDADALSLLRASFPGGSITGAPKVRAMEIITELEPSERGVYCGAIGYWSVTGAFDSNIAIRTVVALDGRVYVSAGGGIVADSDPEQEYRETLDKARGMIDALVGLPGSP